MLNMLEVLAGGGTIPAGMDLGVPGYEKITVSATNPKSFNGAAWLIVDKDNASQYHI
jgi:hypothetical protein